MRTTRFKVCLERFGAPYLVADYPVLLQVSLHRLVNSCALNHCVAIEIL